jgi:hypothetical protein
MTALHNTEKIQNSMDNYICSAASLDSIHFLGTCLYSKHCKDSSSGATVQNDLPFEITAVLQEGALVGASSDIVLEHISLVEQLTIVLSEWVSQAAIFHLSARLVRRRNKITHDAIAKF